MEWEQFIESVMPPEISAQTLSIAVRVASACVEPAALAHSVRPFHVMQTSTRCLRRLNIPYVISAAKTKAAAMPIKTPVLRVIPRAPQKSSPFS